jgi:hypothetical protein
MRKRPEAEQERVTRMILPSELTSFEAQSLLWKEELFDLKVRVLRRFAVVADRRADLTKGLVLRESSSPS